MKNNFKKYCFLALIILLPLNFLFSQESNTQVFITLPEHTLRIEIISSNIIRISEVNGNTFPDKKSLSVLPIEHPFKKWLKEETSKLLKITTDSIYLEANKINGGISFFNNKGKLILRTAATDTGNFHPAEVDNENVFHVKQKFIITKEEAIYGLGQFEDPIMNYRGHDILIAQANRIAVNPFLVSTNGYGILWDNYSETRFHDGASGTYFYSEVADQIDYYFVYGSTMDQIITGYRFLTGNAPLFDKGVYGYWQSKNYYKTEDELISIVKEYRKRKIPLDYIVQDAQYWPNMNQFSGMVWDSSRYPDPKKMIDSIHSLNAHLMVSIWPAFGDSSEIYKEMLSKNLLYNEMHWSGGKVYDAYNPEARNIYWKYIKKGLFNIGVDAFWMDGTEPEFRCTDDRYITALSIKKAGKNYLGTNARYLNTYSLETTKGVYEHQRETTDKKRVFILTRSTFAGQQRYAAVTWSGDTFATWDALKTQIAAGINFSLSGLPYWTNDIGGFITSFNYPAGVKDDAYKELYVRWFQFGAFCPIFRSHGTNTPREVWQFGNKRDWAYDALVKADKLRYRLMPYIYSIAWRITSQDYTMMRGLVMDFPYDKRTYSINNQFMFGPSIMVSPVTKEVFHPASYNGADITPDHFYSADGKEHGLQLDIYKGTNFNQLISSRKFESSQITWIGCLPENLDSGYSIKINGKISSEKDGIYKFFVLTDAGIKLWINNKLLIDKWNNKDTARFETTIPLEANKKYDFKIFHKEFRKNTAYLKINWIKPEHFQNPGKKNVYLPKNISWYNFWTGEKITGGKNINLDIPIDIIPLYIPAGSIIPLGPEIQYAIQSSDPIELRIYRGKNGSFNLYEDENDNYDYEKGIYSIIPFKWDDKLKVLTIGKRKGEFPGMLKDRTFEVILVKGKHGAGIDITDKPDKIINYTGNEIKVKF